MKNLDSIFLPFEKRNLSSAFLFHDRLIFLEEQDLGHIKSSDTDQIQDLRCLMRFVDEKTKRYIVFLKTK